MVREYADPDFAGLAGVMHDGLAGGFDLVRGHAAVLHGFDAERAECERDAASIGVRGFLDGIHAHSEPLAVFYFFWV
jgi:hypothetical protein